MPTPMLSWLLAVALAPAADVPFEHVIIDPQSPLDPHCKTVRDLNGDRFPDVIAASATNGGLSWYAYPLWTERQIATGSFTTDMQAADIDRDFDFDLVTFRTGVGVVWFENPRPDGDPATDPWVEHLIDHDDSAHDVEVAFIDADQRLDVVTRHKGGLATTIFFQDSPTSWTKRVVSQWPGEGTALADVDLDGDRDIVHNGVWIENPDNPRAAPTPWVTHEFAHGWPEDTGVHVANLDADLRPEIIMAPSESASGVLAWFDSDDPKGGLGAWKTFVIDPDVSYLHTFKTADMDGDGSVDLVTAEMHQSANPDEVSIYRNDIAAGQLEQWHQQVVATSGSHNLRLDDIDGDSDMDIVGANWDDGADNGAPIEMWRNLTVAAKFTVVLTVGRDRAHAGTVLAFSSACPDLPGAPAALLVSDVAGVPYLRMLAVGSLDAIGLWERSFSVPPGLAQIDVSFFTAALAPNGGVRSNGETVRFE